MTHKRYILWSALALISLLMGCTNDETVTYDIPVPADSRMYSYKMYLNMAMPGAATRAEYAWPEGSEVQFRFDNNGYNTDGTATYAKGEWTAHTSKPLFVVDGQPCAARYLRPDENGNTPQFLTPIFSGNSKYACKVVNEKDSVITIDTLTLQPATWRMRFTGENGTVLSLSSSDIVDDLSNKLTDNLVLIVADDGYTPYVYALFANTTGNNNITVETGGNTFHKDIDGSIVRSGSSGVLSVPTEKSHVGWKMDTYINVSETLDFNTDGEGKTLRVESNATWTVSIVYVDGDGWLKGIKTGDSNYGEKEVTLNISAEKNIAQKKRMARIVFSAEGIDNKEVVVTQAGTAPYTDITSKSEIEFGSSANTTGEPISVDSNEGWTLTVETEDGTGWCHVSPDEGENSGYVMVTVDENSSTDERRATVTVHGRNSNDHPSVSIVQKGKDAELNFSVNPVRLTADGAGIQLTVYCNASWTVDNNGYGWLKCNPSQGNANTDVTISASPNDNEEPLYGKLTFTAGGKPFDLEVTQEGVDLRVPANCEFEANSDYKNLEISCNRDDWETQVSGEANYWCSVSKNGERLRVSVSENPYTTRREAIVTVSVGNVKKEIKVTQRGKDIVYYTKVKESETTINFKTPDEDSATLTIDSNEDWTAMLSANASTWGWEVTTDKAKGTATITIAKNTTANEHKGTVTITGKESGDKTDITVIQPAIELNVSPRQLSFDTVGGSQNLTVDCNSKEWSASSDKSWCTVQKIDSKTLKVTVAKNASTEQLTATVTVTAGEVTVPVTIKQSGNSSITVDPFGDDENWD